MKSILFYCSICLLVYSCQVHSVPLKNDADRAMIKISSSYPIKETWDKIVESAFNFGLHVKTQDKANGTMVLASEEAILTILGKDGKPENKDAVAYTEIQRKGSNRDRIFAQKGSVEFNLLIQDDGNTSTVFIRCNEKGTITHYYQNGFNVVKPIRDVNIWSTGVLEKRISDGTK